MPVDRRKPKRKKKKKPAQPEDPHVTASWKTAAVTCGSSSAGQLGRRQASAAFACSFGLLEASGAIACPVAVACGGDLTLVVDGRRGTVLACGAGASGVPACGGGGGKARARSAAAAVASAAALGAPRPLRPIPRLAGVASVACGSTGEHAAAITREGALFMWGVGRGRNAVARLGHGHSGTEAASGGASARSRPRQVAALAGRRAVAVACGAEHTAAIIAARGHTHTRAERQELYTFGSGRAGQLGHGDTDNRYTPVRVAAWDLSPPRTPSPSSSPAPPPAAPHSSDSGGGGVGGAGTDWPAEQPCVLLGICCGMHHTVAIVSCPGTGVGVGAGNSSVFSWGWGEHGRLGLGDTSMRTSPEEVLVRGSAMGGATRSPSPSPSPLASPLRAAVGVAAGARHTLCWTAQGELWAWGDDSFAQLGLGFGSSDTDNVLCPALVHAAAAGEGGGVVTAAAGEFHSAAIDSAGKLHTFGWGAMGQLGDGGGADRPRPAPVVVPPEVLAGALRAEAGVAAAEHAEHAEEVEGGGEARRGGVSEGEGEKAGAEAAAGEHAALASSAAAAAALAAATAAATGAAAAAAAEADADALWRRGCRARAKEKARKPGRQGRRVGGGFVPRESPSADSTASAGQAGRGRRASRRGSSGADWMNGN
eukprot:g5098.t1